MVARGLAARGERVVRAHEEDVELQQHVHLAVYLDDVEGREAEAVGARKVKTLSLSYIAAADPERAETLATRQYDASQRHRCRYPGP